MTKEGFGCSSICSDPKKVQRPLAGGRLCWAVGRGHVLPSTLLFPGQAVPSVPLMPGSSSCGCHSHYRNFAADHLLEEGAAGRCKGIRQCRKEWREMKCLQLLEQEGRGSAQQKQQMPRQRRQQLQRTGGGALLGCGLSKRGIGQHQLAFPGRCCLDQRSVLPSRGRAEGRGKGPLGCRISVCCLLLPCWCLWQVSPLGAPLFGARRSLVPHS